MTISLKEFFFTLPFEHYELSKIEQQYSSDEIYSQWEILLNKLLKEQSKKTHKLILNFHKHETVKT